MTEHRAGRGLFDVVSNSGFEMHLLNKARLLGRYQSPEFNAFFADSKDRGGYWVDMYSNVRVVTYNTRLVAKEKMPRAYEDLLDPAWKGAIGFPEGQYAWYGTMMRVMGDDKGKKFMHAPLPFVTKNMHPLGLAAAAPHPNAGKLFIDYMLSREAQTLMKNLGRVVSRSDIPQEELGRFKMIADDITLVDRLNPLMEEYRKYFQ